MPNIAGDRTDLLWGTYADFSANNPQIFLDIILSFERGKTWITYGVVQWLALLFIVGKSRVQMSAVLSAVFSAYP
jgi:hypothetical protein